MSTSGHTGNYGLSQYATGDPVKFLTNYNQDMAAIDAAVKAAKDGADAAVPKTRTIAGLPLTGDLTLAQLIAKGLASGDGSGNANNALKLGSADAANFPQISSGTWTPTLYGAAAAGAPVYDSSYHTGDWVKIGTLVFVSAILGITSKGGMAGIVCVGGLPFPVSSNIPSAASKGAVRGVVSADVSGYFYKSLSGIVLSKAGTGVFADLDAADIADNFLLNGISGWYLTQS